VDFRFTPEDRAFQHEVRAFLDPILPRDAPWEWEPMDGGPVARAVQAKLGAKGYLHPGWPKEYGGLDLDFVKQAILKEELAYRRLPHVAAGSALAGPIIMAYGTDEQKQEHLLSTARGERHWCQWFSEPNAGSDMANSQTAATSDGDDYVINGVKLWHDPDFDWGLLMARTDPSAPKHRGISFILMERKAAGVTVQPLEDLANGFVITQTFFDNARVPKANLVGEENRGWYVAMSAMNLERSGISRPGSARRQLDEVLAYARDRRAGGRPLIDQPLVTRKLAQMHIEVELARVMSYRIASMMRQGLAPDVESASNKLYASEMVQRLAQGILEILGLHGQLEPEQERAPLRGFYEKNYMRVIPDTIAEGTSEIQRTIIATRGLGLPRG
jgi:alkylation response protein AidB-like acyl-CoA dehydrogenase